MAAQRRVDVWYSLKSDYCYFLLDRLLALAGRDVEIGIRPVHGIMLRMPDYVRGRGAMEELYFKIDVRRTAAYLGVPYAPPAPNPIAFEPTSIWVAAQVQPRIDRLSRLFVGDTRQGLALPFLDKVGRGLWNGANANWHQSGFLNNALALINLDHDALLDAVTSESAEATLQANHEAMLATGHWGVPLMAYESEPFYGQDRFEQLLWRMEGPRP